MVVGRLQRSVAHGRGSGTRDVGQLGASELLARAGDLKNKDRGFGYHTGILIHMRCIDEYGVLVCKVELLFVATVHRIGGDRRAVGIAAVDGNVGVVLQGEHKSIVEIVVPTATRSRCVVADVRGRRHHDVLPAGHAFRHELVGHKVRTAVSVVRGLRTVRGHRVVGNIHRDGIVGGDDGTGEMVGGGLRAGGEGVNLSPLQRDRERRVGRMPDARLRRRDRNGGVILRSDNLDGVLRLRVGTGAATASVGKLELGGDEELRAETVTALEGVNLAVILTDSHVCVNLGGRMDVEAVVDRGIMVALEIAESGGIGDQRQGAGGIGRNVQRVAHLRPGVGLRHRDRGRFAKGGNHQRDGRVRMFGRELRHGEPECRIHLRETDRKQYGQQNNCKKALQFSHFPITYFKLQK